MRAAVVIASIYLMAGVMVNASPYEKERGKILGDIKQITKCKVPYLEDWKRSEQKRFQGPKTYNLVKQNHRSKSPGTVVAIFQVSDSSEAKFKVLSTVDLNKLTLQKAVESLGDCSKTSSDFYRFRLKTTDGFACEVRGIFKEKDAESPVLLKYKIIIRGVGSTTWMDT